MASLVVPEIDRRNRARTRSIRAPHAIPLAMPENALSVLLSFVVAFAIAMACIWAVVELIERFGGD